MIVSEDLQAPVCNMTYWPLMEAYGEGWQAYEIEY